MKKLIIIRGLPGSGKSKFAHSITSVVCEADDYFYQDGIYKFDHSKLKEAHRQCQTKVFQAMQANVPVIAVSNTAVRRWEMDIYYGFAISFGYEVTEVTMSQELRKSIHGVPDEVIERMKETWEK